MTVHHAGVGAAQAVCLGESMAVLLPDRRGPLDTVTSFAPAVGGAESNVACALAALGVSAAWVSRVGADGFGRRLTEELAARGVDVSGVLTDPERATGVYLKETGGTDHPHDLGPGRSRLHYYRNGSAASALSPAVLAEPAVARLLDGARLLHLSGITPALSDGCLALVRALLADRRPGRLVSFDLNWRPALWRDRDPAVLPALLDAADVLLLGADEAEAAFGAGEPGKLRELFPSPGVLVVKDAAHQASEVGKDGSAVTEPALAVEVLEPTGAGDAFAGGYLAGTLRGLGGRGRLRLGHLCAASALTTPGDHGVLPPERVISALLAASAEEWAATRVTADGIVSPVLP
ncbi:sugar kinase [Kitasatospora albolonga]|uniref:sugar kinase n=1 Tax=Kitasatospora albolonga TaxID=68173 RepID=UPI0031E8EC87